MANELISGKEASKRLMEIFEKVCAEEKLSEGERAEAFSMVCEHLSNQLFDPPSYGRVK